MCRKGLAERAGRLDGAQERPGDRGELVNLMALAVLYARLCSDAAPPDRKAVRAALDLHARVPTLSSLPYHYL